MQIVSPASPPPPKFAGKERFADVYGKLSDDFDSKLKVGFTEEEDRHQNLEKPWWNQEAKTDDDDEEEGEEFSFASVNAENSPITAEDAFEDGQIRPVYPLFNQDLLFDYEREEKAQTLRLPLKKLFLEGGEEPVASTAEDSEPMGPYCSWKGRTVVESSPETCRKSYSTGFSKLWRFRDLVLRSKSDGKDAFVFLSGRDGGEKSHSSLTAAGKSSGVKRTEKEKKKTEKKMKTTKSAHERLYMRNRANKEEEKRRSYLPYRHVGFFTNVNGLTRNVHPY